MSAEKFNFENLNQSFQTIDNYENNIKQAKTYLSGEKLEYYLASYIFFQSWASKDNSKDIINIYDQFKREYPDSRYQEYLITSVRPIIDFHEKPENAPTNEKIQLVKNQENIDTFDELIKELRGKKIFVDIWGNWCGPCKKEFQLKDKYAEILKSKEIIILYICEGKNSKKKNWSEMIEFYELEGQHIFTNEKLLADIHDRFGKNGFAYPRYLLVDENGKVVNEQASYPSKTEQLEKEIKENYVW
ncbi:TlpA family protein disulfide reductase [Arenibacter algicola]|uniref:TlpA family protein disulfide reductase n=1 Tax=Arenibacter algicola TaxID=616991 RepID=UPI001D0511B2